MLDESKVMAHENICLDLLFTMGVLLRVIDSVCKKRSCLAIILNILFSCTRKSLLHNAY